MSKKNSLDDTRMLALYEWCKTRKTDLAEIQRPTLATIATAALGFNVTESNIKRMCVALKVPRVYKSTGRRLDTKFVAEKLLRVVELLEGGLWASSHVGRDVCNELRMALKVPAEVATPPATTIGSAP